MKQIIKSLDKSNQYDKIVGSLDSLTGDGKARWQKKYPIYQLLDDSTEHYLKA